MPEEGELWNPPPVDLRVFDAAMPGFGSIVQPDRLPDADPTARIHANARTAAAFYRPSTTSRVLDYVPLVGVGRQLGNWWTDRRIGQAMAAGTAEPWEIQHAHERDRENQLASERVSTWTGLGTDLALRAPSYAAEFWATGPIKKGVQALVGRALGTGLAARAAGAGLGIVAQSHAMPSGVPSTLLQRMATPNAAGQYPSAASVYPAAAFDAFTETLTEHLGGTAAFQSISNALGRRVGGLSNAALRRVHLQDVSQLVTTGITNRINRLTRSFPGRMAHDALEAGGFHGVFNEWVEERLGEYMRGAFARYFGDEQNDAGAVGHLLAGGYEAVRGRGGAAYNHLVSNFLYQSMAEGLGFSLYGGVGHGLGATAHRLANMGSLPARGTAAFQIHQDALTAYLSTLDSRESLDAAQTDLRERMDYFDVQPLLAPRRSAMLEAQVQEHVQGQAEAAALGQATSGPLWNEPLPGNATSPSATTAQPISDRLADTEVSQPQSQSTQEVALQSPPAEAIGRRFGLREEIQRPSWLRPSDSQPQPTPGQAPGPPGRPPGPPPTRPPGPPFGPQSPVQAPSAPIPSSQPPGGPGALIGPPSQPGKAPESPPTRKKGLVAGERYPNVDTRRIMDIAADLDAVVPTFARDKPHFRDTLIDNVLNEPAGEALLDRENRGPDARLPVSAAEAQLKAKLAKLNPRERHVAEQQLKGRSLSSIAQDPEMRGKNGPLVPESIRLISNKARDGLGLTKSLDAIIRVEAKAGLGAPVSQRQGKAGVPLLAAPTEGESRPSEAKARPVQFDTELGKQNAAILNEIGLDLAALKERGLSKKEIRAIRKQALKDFFEGAAEAKSPETVSVDLVARIKDATATGMDPYRALVEDVPGIEEIGGARLQELIDLAKEYIRASELESDDFAVDREALRLSLVIELQRPQTANQGTQRGEGYLPATPNVPAPGVAEAAPVAEPGAPSPGVVSGPAAEAAPPAAPEKPAPKARLSAVAVQKERKAVELGVNPLEARWLANEEWASRVESHERKRGILKDAKRQLAALYKQKGLSMAPVHFIGTERFEDADSVPFLDDVALSMSGDPEYQDIFQDRPGVREDYTEKLFDMLHEGAGPAPTLSQAYDDAIAYLSGRLGTHSEVADANSEFVQRSEEPFSPAEIKDVTTEALRWVEAPQDNPPESLRAVQGGALQGPGTPASAELGPDVAHAPAERTGDVAGESDWWGDPGTFDPAEWGDTGVSQYSPRTGAPAQLFQQMWDDSEGLIYLDKVGPALKWLALKAQAGLKEILQTYRALGSEVAPVSSDIDPEVGNKMARFGFSPFFAVQAGAYYADLVLGEGATDSQALVAGATLTERRLRHMKDFYNKLAADLWQRAQTATNPADRAEFLAASAKASNIARGVFTTIGATGSPFATLADYTRALNHPYIKGVIQRWDQHFVKVMESQFRRAEGLPANAPIVDRTQVPGSPMNLLPAGEEPGIFGVVSRPKQGNPQGFRMKKFGFAMQATGSADAYNLDLRAIINNTMVRGAPAAAQADLIRYLESAGHGVWAGRGQGMPLIGPNGDLETEKIEKIQPAKGTQANTQGQQDFWVDKRMYEELERLFQVSQPMRLHIIKQFNDLVTRAALLSLVEFEYHSKNILTMLFKPGMGNVWDPTPISAIVHLIRDGYKIYKKNPALMKQLLDLAEMGAAKSHQGFEASTYSWLKWGGSALDFLQKATRVQMHEAFGKLRSMGLAVGSEQNERNFINQLGMYEIRLQHKLIAWLRESAFSPFATASFNFYVQSQRALTGNAGVKAPGKMAAVALRAWYLGKVYGVFAATLLYNFLRWGRPDGDDETEVGAIKLGTDAQGRTIQWNPTNFTGVTRGLRQFGFMGLIEQGYRRGRPGRVVETRAVGDITHSALHLFIGPPVQFAITAVSGYNTLWQKVDYEPVPGEFPGSGSPVVRRLLAAAANMNPSVAQAFGWNKPYHDRAWWQVIMEMLAPYGPKVRGGTENRDAERIRRRLHEQILRTEGQRRGMRN